MLTIYSVELPDITVRGAMAVIPDIILALGFIGCVALGFVLRWYQIPFVGIGVCIACFIAMFFIPESPTYLVITEREFEARKVLQSLRGPDANVDEEIWMLHEKNVGVSSTPLLKVLTQIRIIKSFAIVFFLFFLMNFCGLAPLEVNATRILIDIGSTVDENAVAVLLFSAELVGSCFSFFLLDRIGRRNSMILSLAVGAICLLVFGTYIHLMDSQVPCSGLEANGTIISTSIDNMEHTASAAGTINSTDSLDR